MSESGNCVKGDRSQASTVAPLTVISHGPTALKTKRCGAEAAANTPMFKPLSGDVYRQNEN
jgi:hypothetical protein